MEPEKLLEYHKHNTSYIGDYIKFADQKAGLALPTSLGLVAFFGLQLKKQGISHMDLWQVGLLIGVLALLFSSYLLVWRVLWPRYSKDHNWYLSWGGISGFQDSVAYASHLQQISVEQFVTDFARQNHELAKICAKKYDYLRFAFISLSLGAILSTLCWLFGMK